MPSCWQSQKPNALPRGPRTQLPLPLGSQWSLCSQGSQSSVGAEEYRNPSEGGTGDVTGCCYSCLQLSLLLVVEQAPCVQHSNASMMHGQGK